VKEKVDKITRNYLIGIAFISAVSIFLLIFDLISSVVIPCSFFPILIAINAKQRKEEEEIKHMMARFENE